MNWAQTSRNESYARVGILEPQMAPAAYAASASKESQARPSTIVPSADHLVTLALRLPDLRTARVEALKAQIKAGTYEVAPEDVAEALLSHMRWPAE